MIWTLHINESEIERSRRDSSGAKLSNPLETELRRLGAVRYNLWLPESHALRLIIHADERLEGIVYGRYEQAQPGGKIIGRGMLAATDRRILLIDKKPLFIRCAEIDYDVVSAVTYGRVLLIGTVTLHTRTGDITVRTFNQKCAHGFVEAVEAHLFDNPDSFPLPPRAL